MHNHVTNCAALWWTGDLSRVYPAYLQNLSLMIIQNVHILRPNFWTWLDFLRVVTITLFSTKTMQTLQRHNWLFDVVDFTVWSFFHFNLFSTIIVLEMWNIVKPLIKWLPNQFRSDQKIWDINTNSTESAPLWHSTERHFSNQRYLLFWRPNNSYQQNDLRAFTKEQQLMRQNIFHPF